MTFKPKAAPKIVAPKNWQRLVVNLRSDEQDLRASIESAAQRSGLTVAQFCREAIKYALANMEQER